MKYYINPKNFFGFLHFMGRHGGIWPLKKGASRKEILIHEFKWWIALFITCSAILPLILAVYHFRKDSTRVTRALTELLSMTEIFVNIILFRIQKIKFQEILYEIGDFIENCNMRQESLLQGYLNRYISLQLFTGISFISTAIVFIFMPIVTTQVLPADAWYPFSIEPFPIHALVYTMQVLAMLQDACSITMDITLAMMLWYSAAQVELLEKKVYKAMGKEEIIECARRHQELIIFTDNLQEAIRFIILKLNATMLTLVICSAFQLIHHEPLEDLLRFALITIASFLRVYVSAKPADDLRENCEQLAQIAFQTALLQKSPSTSKLCLMFSYRCQKPIVLSVTGLLRCYTLEYYAAFMGRFVTNFMNLKAALDD